MKKNNKKKEVKKEKSDGISRDQTQWVYSETVREHFFNPSNFMKPEEEATFKSNASGMVGSPACGDVMRFWLWINPKTEVIEKCRWRTFGCGAAIAFMWVVVHRPVRELMAGMRRADKIRAGQY